MSKKADITVEEVAKILRKNPQFVRIGLQQNRLPFGNAVKTTSGRWSYVIYPEKFYETIGKKRESEVS